MKEIRHVGIVVTNLDKALEFYKDILGFYVVRKMYETGEYIDNLLALKGVKVKTIKLAADDENLIELLYFESHSRKAINKDVCDIGYSHVAFTVENLGYEYKRLKKKGVKFYCSPQISPDKRVKVVFCRDPEGNIIELVEELV